MKIALFTDTFYPKTDGVVVSITNLIEHLAPQGAGILVFCPDYHAEIRRRFPPGTEIVRLPSVPLPQYRDFRFVIPLVNRCVDASKRFGVELVHIHSYASLGFVGAEVARRLGVPLLGTYHTLAAEFTRYLSPVTFLGIDRLLSRYPAMRTTLPKPRRNPIKAFIWKETIRLFNRCDVVVAPSVVTAQALKSRGLRSPLVTISNGIELVHFPFAERSYTGNPRLVHVGRLSFEKRVDIVLQAFARIARRLPGATLTVAGDGPALPGLRTLAERLGIARAVRFLGFVPRGRLASIYSMNDLFLTASPMETQGVVLLESMSCGVPVIGVDRGAIPDLVLNGYNGYVAKRPHAARMADRAVEVLRSPETLERLRVGARATVAEHDTMHTNARLANLYRGIIDPCP